MKRVLQIFPLIFLLSTLFTGCTSKKEESKNTQEPSSSPIIDFEVPDKVEDYDFNYKFIPGNE